MATVRIKGLNRGHNCKQEGYIVYQS